jgi:hypothetical protein
MESGISFRKSLIGLKVVPGLGVMAASLTRSCPQRLANFFGFCILVVPFGPCSSPGLSCRLAYVFKKGADTIHSV